MILPGSYQNGFAPRDGRPLYPELWRSCVFAAAPCLGPTGLTLRDWSGFGNHGTLTSMDAAADVVISGGKYSLNFDAIDNYVAVPDSDAINPVKQIAIGCWFRQSTNHTGMIVCKTNETEYRIFVAGGSVNADVTIGGSYTRVTATASLGTTWHHVFFTYDGANRRLFLDGIMADSNAATGDIATSSNNLRIGIQQGPVFPFNGQIDDIRIYNRALNASEITVLSSRRGIAYEMAPRRRSSSAVQFNRRRTLSTGVY